MDKKRLEPREMTVRNVWEFIKGYDEKHVHALQQILMAFGAAPKMERILWALLKKEYIRRKEYAEEENARFLAQQEKNPNDAHLGGLANREGCKDGKEPREPTPEEVEARKKKALAGEKTRGNMYKKSLEEDPLPFTVGLCPRCDSVVKGGPIPSCEKRKSGRWFYKECTACTYYAEVIKKRNKFKEVEGG
jgi:hypothetical protein